MGSIEYYAAMFPSIDRIIIEELVSQGLPPDNILCQLEEMHSLTILQLADGAGGQTPGTESCLDRHGNEERAMMRRLQTEFRHVDADVISFVLSSCANNEQGAWKALKMQQERALSSGQLGEGLRSGAASGDGGRRGTTAPRDGSASLAALKNEFVNADEAIIALVLSDCGNDHANARVALRQMLHLTESEMLGAEGSCPHVKEPANDIYEQCQKTVKERKAVSKAQDAWGEVKARENHATCVDRSLLHVPASAEAKTQSAEQLWQGDEHRVDLQDGNDHCGKDHAIQSSSTRFAKTALSPHCLLLAAARRNLQFH